MGKRKLILVSSFLVMVLTVVAFVLGSSSARAQGFDEWNYCLSKALNVHVDYSTVPVTDPDKIEELEAIFPELDPWQDNYGATAFCTPKFSKYKPLYPDGDDDVWTRLDFCIIAYEDHELNGVFSSFDRKLAEVCEKYKFDS